MSGLAGDRLGQLARQLRGEQGAHSFRPFGDVVDERDVAHDDRRGGVGEDIVALLLAGEIIGMILAVRQPAQAVAGLLERRAYCVPSGTKVALAARCLPRSAVFHGCSVSTSLDRFVPHLRRTAWRAASVVIELMRWLSPSRPAPMLQVRVCDGGATWLGILPDHLRSGFAAGGGSLREFPAKLE
jgi:hypothetical protein